jgi:long-chain acyl-CoA synthetase
VGAAAASIYSAGAAAFLDCPINTCGDALDAARRFADRPGAGYTPLVSSPQGPEVPPAAGFGAVPKTGANRLPTILERIREAVQMTPSGVAVRERTAGGEACDTSFADLWRAVGELALGLQALGLGRGDRVILYGENRPELLRADLATIAGRGLSVPLYPGAPAATTRAHCKRAGAKIAIVESGPPLARFLEAVRDLPERPRTITFGDRVPGAGGEIRALGSVEADGRRRLERDPRAFEDAVEAARVTDEVTIAFSAGTSGAPKGALLRHEHALGFDFEKLFVKVGPGDVGLVHLPFANAFARLCVAYRLLFAGATLAFADPRGPVLEAVTDLRPTLLFTHQGVLDQAEQQILAEIRDRKARRRSPAEWALELMTRLSWRRGGAKLANLVLVRKVRSLFGGRLRVLYVGGLANRATIRFLHDAGLPLYRGYGAAEITPLVSLNRPDAAGEQGWKPGTAGKPLGGTEVRIADDGEVLVRAAGLAKAYWHGDAGDVCDAAGWFATGDLGRIDEDGFLAIEDRKADAIRLADGTTVLPRPVETKLRESRLITQAALFGGGRPHVVALIVPSTRALAGAAEARKLGSLRPPELLSSPQVHALLSDEIERCLAAFPPAARPKQFRFLSMRFAEASGELSPAQGLRRTAIEERYRAQIEALYAAGG